MQHRNRSSAHRIAMVATAAALALLGVAAGAGLPTPSAGAAVVAFTVTFDAGTHVAAGTSGTLTITAPTPYVGTVHVDSNGTASGLPTDVQFSGQTSKQVTGVALTSAGIQTITAQDTTISANNGSVDITVDPGPATHLAASIGAAPVGAGMHGVAVTALDAYGNTATSFTDTVHLAASDPRAVTSPDHTFTTTDHGAYTFLATLPTVGAQSVTASDVTASSAVDPATATFTVTPGPTSHLAVYGTPSPLAIGTAADVTVAAADTYGNVTPGYTGTVHFAASDASSRVPADYTFAAGDNGVHTFSKALMFGHTGSITVTATDVATSSIAGSETLTLVDPTTSGGGGSAPTGYSLVGADGAVYHFGTADLGSMSGQHLNAPIIGIAMTPTGNGYWLVAKDGGIFSYGDAAFLGSMGGEHLNQPVLGMEVTPSGQGYWLFAADGGIFSFGDAVFHGSTGDFHLNSPVTGMAARLDGRGYWLIAADGGIFSFDAPFAGSMGGQPLNQPMFDMASTPDSSGYWLVAKDGGIFTFGDAQWYGSAVGKAVAPAVGIAASPTGLGYWVADAHGEVFAFGDATFLGDVRFRTLPAPIVGFAALRPAP